MQASLPVFSNNSPSKIQGFIQFSVCIMPGEFNLILINTTFKLWLSASNCSLKSISLSFIFNKHIYKIWIQRKLCKIQIQSLLALLGITKFILGCWLSACKVPANLSIVLASSFPAVSCTEPAVYLQPSGLHSHTSSTFIMCQPAICQADKKTAGGPPSSPALGSGSEEKTRAPERYPVTGLNSWG